MTARYFAPAALLDSGWATDVLFEIDTTGMIAAITPHAVQGDTETLRGPVIPGMPNLHSHAFQRAMAGLTERSGPQGDSFWTWREWMYRFLDRLTPDDIEIIATQLYIEMLQAGYTSVAEFHYLHHDPAGIQYANPAEIGERHIAAAQATGIGLTMLPVFYAHSTFGGAPPSPGQRRFVNDVESFASIVESLATAIATRPGYRIGIAPHSLRAVAPQELHALIELGSSLGAHTPIHIHAAEQQKEVDDCIEWSGQRPVAWLLDHAPVDRRWCLIHATHLDDVETVRLAQAGAVAGLCPTTEGDLGDGFFNAVPYLEAGGRFGLGGDSHVGVDPFLELRLFEYGQRLRLQRRNLLSGGIGQSVGGSLYRSACTGGAQALAQPVGVLKAGRRADWIVLNTRDPALATHSGDTLLDAAIFGPARVPVRDVMVSGQWQVRDGVHSLAAWSAVRFGQAMSRLLR